VRPGSNVPIIAIMRFDLMLNLKSAKAIGLDVPPTFLASADEVIE
jgi:putative ABC transport system substrate-binding protein